MKEQFKKFLPVLKNRIFLISFFASFAVVVVIILIMALARNNNDTESVFSEAPTSTPFVPRATLEPAPEPTPDPTPEPTPVFLSMFTGLEIEEELVTRRPLAVVINNIRQALPQSGIASADVIYEVLAEGDVTRLVAIFQSYIPEKIGSIRSTRDYFIDFAWNHDAIFIFHGGSPAGYGRVRSTGITHMDGGRLEGQIFWRDRTYPEWTGNSGTRSTEHSSYTGRENILKHFEENEIRDYIIPDPAFGFTFGEFEQETLGEARRVTVPFSRNYTRTFIYEPDENIYWVENNQGKHQDADTQEQVSVTNILVQFTTKAPIPGDYAGRRNVTTVGNGRGYLITGGEYYPVLWEKSSHTNPMRWTFDDGTPLVMQPGKTWINVFQSNGTVDFNE